MGWIVKVDGVFETALGLTLLIPGTAGWLGTGDFPAPVGRPFLIAVGIGLVAFGWMLWRTAPTTFVLRVLAAGNATTAALALVWVVRASGFSAAGSALTIATASALTGLAAVQIHLLGIRRPGTL